MHEDTSQIDFPFAGRRQVRAAFDAGPISSDGGLLLLRQADRRLGLTEALAQALPDWREKRRVEHSDLELIRQRIYGICAGYEDCNDAKTMRRDPVLKAACDRDPDEGADLASQPTLSRFENEVGPKSSSGSSAWPESSPSRRAVVSCARARRLAYSSPSDIAPRERAVSAGRAATA